MVRFEGASDERPCLLKVDFSILGEEGGKGGFFGEGASSIVRGLKRIFLVGKQ